MNCDLAVEPHPLLDAAWLFAEYPAGLAQATPVAPDLLRLTASAPLAPDDAARAAVRDLLRHGGFKPTGRSKPSSEYLLRAAGEQRLDSINAAVDAGNVASLHSGLPISVIDLDRVVAPLRIGIAAEGERFVFNRSGQEIDVSGLLCLHDAAGPCANAVKDAQRTKTDGDTRRTLTVVWGTSALPGRVAATVAWLRALIASSGGVVSAPR